MAQGLAEQMPAEPLLGKVATAVTERMEETEETVQTEVTVSLILFHPLIDQREGGNAGDGGNITLYSADPKLFWLVETRFASVRSHFQKL